MDTNWKYGYKIWKMDKKMKIFWNMEKYGKYGQHFLKFENFACFY